LNQLLHQLRLLRQLRQLALMPVVNGLLRRRNSSSLRRMLVSPRHLEELLPAQILHHQLVLLARQFSAT
jgi:hypothetical protein